MRRHGAEELPQDTLTSGSGHFKPQIFPGLVRNTAGMLSPSGLGGCGSKCCASLGVPPRWVLSGDVRQCM
jgi:hypothetical protein